MSNNQPHQVKRRFAQLRKKFGSQSQFGEASGLKQSQVSWYENGERPISDGAYALMENTIKLNRQWLEEGTGQMFIDGKTPRPPRKDAGINPIGDRLRSIRKEKKLSAIAFAQTVGVTGPTITRYETGIIQIPNTLINKLSEVHGINTAWLLSGTGEPYTNEPAKKTIALDVASILRQLDTLNQHARTQDKEIASLKGRLSAAERELSHLKQTRKTTL
jgi:transcriptional regulator with XRE-family HTH domain